MKDTTTKRRVLFPVDASDHSERAVKWYLEFASRTEDYLCLFHSIDTSGAVPMMAMGAPVASVEALIEEKKNEAKQLKTKFDTLLESSGIKGEFIISNKHAHAGEAVVHACKDHNIDHVIMGNRGQGIVRRTFLGSTSDYVLHHAHVPITIIPPVKAEE